jgi:hypothetical protein
MSMRHGMNLPLFVCDVVYYSLCGSDSRRERSLSADIDDALLNDGLRTTVSLMNVRGRQGFVCDVKYEATWPELVSASQVLADWLEEKALFYEVTCSGSQKSWIRFRVYGIADSLALPFIQQWAGLSLCADDRLNSDMRHCEARLLEASRAILQVAEQFQGWRGRPFALDAEPTGASAARRTI